VLERPESGVVAEVDLASLAPWDSSSRTDPAASRHTVTSRPLIARPVRALARAGSRRRCPWRRRPGRPFALDDGSRDERGPAGEAKRPRPGARRGGGLIDIDELLDLWDEVSRTTRAAGIGPVPSAHPRHSNHVLSQIQEGILDRGTDGFRACEFTLCPGELALGSVRARENVDGTKRPSGILNLPDLPKRGRTSGL
jgi:hypothetical protein